MNLNLEHPFTSRAHRLLHWGHWFTFLNIFIALLISITYLTPETIPDTTIGWVYLLTSWIGHTAFLCFVCFLGILMRSLLNFDRRASGYFRQ